MKEYGYFSKNGYVITDRNTPRHWYNYLFNNEYIASVSQVGFGKGFAQDDMGCRIPLVEDRAVYIVEENHFWQATGLPIHTSLQHYHCEHGIGYTDIVLTHQRIKSECCFFVANAGKREFLRVTVKNESRHTKSLKVIPYYATDIDGRYEPQCQQSDYAHYHDEKNCVIGTGFANFASNESKRHFAYLMSTDIVTGFDTAHNAFIGTYGNKQAPKALSETSGCTNSDCIAEKICLALENSVTLEPGESKTFYYTVGVEESEETIPQLLPAEIEEQFAAMRQKYSNSYTGIHIRTPWDDLDDLCNDWLKYQADLGSHWASIDSNKLADMITDVECTSCFDPTLAAKRLHRALSYQHSSGYLPHAFSDGKMINDSSADAPISLTFAVYALTKESGSFDFLQKKIPFIGGEVATVYEHVKRALSYLWNHSGHGGLIRSQLCGNDETDSGKGVSIRLSIAFVRAAKMLSLMANWMGSEADSRTAAHYAQEMENRINRYGWDKDHYIEGISDDKHLIGAKECNEGKLFALPQLWSVLSDFDKERREIAMDVLEQELNTDLGLLYCNPPYADQSPLGQKLPGLHENGGIDLHASVWKLAADALLQRNDKIEEGLRKILPTHNEFAETCGEPYVLFDYYLGEQTGYRVGKPGPSWRAAAGPRLLYTLIHFIFGLQPEFGGLLIRPCLPTTWKDCSVSKEFRGCRYNIHYVQKDKGICNTIDSIYVNGLEVNRQLPIKPQVGKTLNVEVILRA